MQDELGFSRSRVDTDRLPENFPTHLHPAEFWEALGRAVATFGFLEETLGKAIFSFTATREYPEGELEAAFEKWLPTLQRALSDPLGSLIDSYGKAVRENGKATVTNLEQLLEDLRKVSTFRNVLCHGSWRRPDANGQSLPLFKNRKNESFKTPIDLPFLLLIQRDTVKLICDVISTVTQIGYQFPGSNSPGDPIIRRC